MFTYTNEESEKFGGFGFSSFLRFIFDTQFSCFTCACPCSVCLCKMLVPPHHWSAHRFKHFICFNNVFYLPLNPNILCINMIFTLHFTALMRKHAFECHTAFGSSTYHTIALAICAHLRPLTNKRIKRNFVLSFRIVFGRHFIDKCIFGAVGTCWVPQ